ncbi:hypothetical protein [uncultured Desulfovibrio sp.]|nr:hypothetical protein [uncultured Desulfovibrio sp.]
MPAGKKSHSRPAAPEERQIKLATNFFIYAYFFKKAREYFGAAM